MVEGLELCAEWRSWSHDGEMIVLCRRTEVHSVLVRLHLIEMMRAQSPLNAGQNVVVFEYRTQKYDSMRRKCRHLDTTIKARVQCVQCPCRSKCANVGDCAPIAQTRRAGP